MSWANGSEAHCRLERLDADAHLVAVLDAVVDVEAVNSRADQAAENGEAFSACRFSAMREPAGAAILGAKTAACASGLLRSRPRPAGLPRSGEDVVTHHVLDRRPQKLPQFRYDVSE